MKYFDDACEGPISTHLIFPSALKALLLGCIVFGALPAVAAQAPLVNPFFVFEDGLGDTSSEGEAALAAKIGFAGISFDDARLVPERLKAVDAHGLQLFFLYMKVDVSGTEPVFEAGFDDAVALLKGRGAIVWLTVRGNGPKAEELAVQAVRRASDLASAANLRVALYPHYGFYVQTLGDAVRLADKAGRSNVGYTFNLCHELRSGSEEADLKRLLDGGINRLYGVSINGADPKGTDWDTLIQPLDRGNFDVAGMVQTLSAHGYRGPIGLQCYAIKGDPESNLKRSMAVWRRVSAATE